MPTISVKRDLLMQKLGKTYSDEQFDELCFQFGIELDEITSEKKMAMKERNFTGKESDEIIYKIDIPANRYDLVCLEGLVLALKIFTGMMEPPDYVVKPSGVRFTADEHVDTIRPVLVGAIVRNVQFDKDLYEEFIDLQDKIHQNIGRKRAMVSVGTHDLDTIQAPFHYTTMKPDELKFVALNETKEYSAIELMDLYEQSHLKPYLHIIKDKPRYPVIKDKKGVVLSMPPIINGDVSKITLNTKNVLVEITATDRAKATIALDAIVSMLTSSNGSYSAESVEIVHADGRKYVTPDMRYQKQSISRTYINKGLGVDLSASDIEKLLTRMGLRAKSIKNTDDIEVHVPPTRHDIIHKCDVMEDVGIAYGYDNIVKTLPKCATIASQVPLNKLSDQLRNELARCGYLELLNFALCSEDELGKMLNRVNVEENLVRIQNPKTVEFQVARTSLLPGLLKTLGLNKGRPKPVKLFEVGDIVLVDTTKDVGARNERHLAAVYQGNQSSGFEIIHGLLDRIMQAMASRYIGYMEEKETCTEGYYIEMDNDDTAYLPGRCTKIIHNRKHIGNMGILHPDVLKYYDLFHPTSALEINIEALDLP